ncbi:unnamed protein product [Rangifer tarandus platyrhynchus]|uniref:Uncharacterized protein n=1 Tax=Rangifer tarandus platyrhynchus TaxID=3082113 RepID=A0ABN8ZZ73_RANTA|nr:unnamed protein product [Rangifer tarandus platyrhynchus]
MGWSSPEMGKLWMKQAGRRQKGLKQEVRCANAEFEKSFSHPEEGVCVRVGVIPLDPASSALQQTGQLTQVSGVLNRGLLPPLEEPSRTQGEPEAVPDVNRSTEGPLGRRTFRLFVGMQELSVWNLPKDFLCCVHTTLAPAVLSPRAEQSELRQHPGGTGGKALRPSSCRVGRTSKVIARPRQRGWSRPGSQLEPGQAAPPGQRACAERDVGPDTAAALRMLRFGKARAGGEAGPTLAPGPSL